MYGEYSLGTPQEFQWLVDNGLLEMIINEGKTFFWANRYKTSRKDAWGVVSRGAGSIRGVFWGILRGRLNFGGKRVARAVGKRYCSLTRVVKLGRQNGWVVLLVAQWEWKPCTSFISKDFYNKPCEIIIFWVFGYKLFSEGGQRVYPRNL